MNHTRYITGLLFLAQIYFFINLVISCSDPLFDFNNPQIINYSPIRSSGIGVNENIFIEFSKPMDQGTVKKSLSFTEKNGYTDYYLLWQDTKLLIIPTTKLKSRKEYKVSLNEGVRDKSGNLLLGKWSITFFTGEYNRDNFLVEGISPANYYIGFNNLRPNIELSFTIPLESDQDFYQLVNFQPKVEGSFMLSQDQKQLSFISTADFRDQTEYSVTVSKDILSTNQIALENEWKTFFFTGNPYQNVFLQGIYPIDQTNNFFRDQIRIYSNFSTLLRTDLGFFFEFSEAMDQSSVKSAISFTPQISGYFDWINDTTVIYHQDEDLTYNTSYEISINNSARSVQGTSISSNYQITLTTRNPYNAPLQITTATVKNACINELNLTEDFSSAPTLSILSNNFTNIFSFSLSTKSSINLLSFYQGNMFSLKCFGRCGNTNPQESRKNIIPSNPILSTPLIIQSSFYDLDPEASSYVLTVSSEGLKDDQGRSLERDFNYIFKPSLTASCP